jgi:NADH:ubiquinone oxidoreductase subunit H
MDWLNLIVIPTIRSVVLIVVLLTGFAYLTWYERKLLARFHVRYGPNRAGPKGLLQPIADAVKAIFKEEIIPGHVDKVVYLLAPALALVPALLIWAVIPIGVGVPAVADVPIGFLWILADHRHRKLRHHPGRAGAATTTTRCSARCVRRRR